MAFKGITGDHAGMAAAQRIGNAVSTTLNTGVFD